MTARRVLAVLLAVLFPASGRHRYIAGADDTVTFPRLRDDNGTGHELTLLDVPPARDRPYIRPAGDDHGGYLP